MAQSLIRGNTQILIGSITADRFITGLNLATSQLQDAANFILRTGTTAFTADQSLGGFKITNLADAINATDGVNLRTAQALINGIAIKYSCRVVAIANLALTAAQTIDGVVTVAGDRVLLTAQTTASQNGPWVVSATAWTRPTDYAAASTQKEGILIIVAEGTTYHDTKWLAITDGVITVDTTATTWTQDLSGIVYTNGNGLSLTGSTFAVKLGFGLSFDGTSSVTVTPNGTSLNVAAAGVKISDGTPGQLMLAGATNAAAFTTITGDVTYSGGGIATVNSTSGSGFLKYAAIVANETPTGAVNSTNTAFTVAFAPAVSSLELFLNGQLLEPGTGNDYTITGAAITTLFVPTTGDKLRAYYTK